MTQLGQESFRLGGGRYILYNIIGQGGMGTVYRAFDQTLERLVAVKCMSDPELQVTSRDLLQKEAKSLASISHAHVLQIYDVIFERDCHWIVSEWLQGRTLGEIQGACGPATVAAIVVQLFDALREIHARKMIHRDIKPTNLFLTDDGVLKLIDFGVAYKPTQSSGATVVGSLRYTDPRILAGKFPDRASDYYATGLVLFELLRGQTVWKESSPLVLYQTIEDTLDERVEELVYGVFPEIAMIARELILSIRWTSEEIENRIVQIESRAKDLAEGLGIKNAERFLAERLNQHKTSDKDFAENLQTIAKSYMTKSNLRAREKSVWLSYCEVMKDSDGLKIPTREIKIKNKSMWPWNIGALSVVVAAILILWLAGEQKKDPISAVVETTFAPSPTVEPTATPVPTPLKKTAAPVKNAKIVPPVEPSTQPPVKVHVVFVASAWGDLKIDGKSMGRLPRPDGFELISGTHLVEFSNPLVETFSENIMINRQAEQTVRLNVRYKLVEMNFILENPGELIIDGKSFGKVREQSISMKVGAHEIQVKRDGETAYTKKIDVRINGAREVNLP